VRAEVLAIGLSKLGRTAVEAGGYEVRCEAPKTCSLTIPAFPAVKWGGEAPAGYWESYYAFTTEFFPVLEAAYEATRGKILPGLSEFTRQQEDGGSTKIQKNDLCPDGFERAIEDQVLSLRRSEEASLRMHVRLDRGRRPALGLARPDPRRSPQRRSRSRAR